MRYVRNLMQLTIAMFALSALAATSASAAVEVRGPSGELCGGPDCQVSLEGKMKIDSGGGLGNFKQCDVDLTMDVDSSGQLVVHTLTAWGSSVVCVMAGNPVMEDCGQAGWAGQILGPGDEGFTGENDFEAVFQSCFEILDYFVPIRFGLDNVDYPAPYESYSHLRWSLEEQPYGAYTFSGTGYDGPASTELDITTVE